jgi:hypothetical protein
MSGKRLETEVMNWVPTIKQVRLRQRLSDSGTYISGIVDDTLWIFASYLGFANVRKSGKHSELVKLELLQLYFSSSQSFYGLSEHDSINVYRTNKLIVGFNTT